MDNITVAIDYFWLAVQGVESYSMSNTVNDKASKHSRNLVPALGLFLASLGTLALASHPMYVIRPFASRLPRPSLVPFGCFCTLSRSCWFSLWELRPWLSFCGDAPVGSRDFFWRLQSPLSWSRRFPHGSIPTSTCSIPSASRTIWPHNRPLSMLVTWSWRLLSEGRAEPIRFAKWHITTW